MALNTMNNVRHSTLRKRWIVVLNFIIILLAVILAYWALAQNKKSIHNDWNSNLLTIRTTTQEALDIWLSNQKQKLRNIASDPKTKLLAQSQLALYLKGGDISNSHELTGLREIFKRLQEVSKHKGFFVIAPDGTNIGSMRDSNLGLKNLVFAKRNENFTKALSGETVFVLPMLSDVPIANTPNISGLPFPSTMFILTPLKLNDGKVIAVLAERLDPLGEFSKILKLGRVGKSGETYVVDGNARMISESRFSKQLSTLKMIAPNTQNVLAIEIKEPKSNTLTVAAKSALNRKSSSDIFGYKDYRGVDVIGSWAWSANIEAAVITEVDKDEAYQTYYTTRFTILIILCVLVIVSVFISILIMSISHKANKALAKSNLTLESRVGQRTRQLEKSKEQLIENERKLQIVLDNISALIYLKDTSGVYLLVNKEWEVTLGLDIDSVVGKTDYELFPENIAKGFISTDHEAMQSLQTVQLENCAPDLNGLIKSYWTSKIPIIGVSGEVTGILGVSVDVTARKVMEAELINAKELAEQANIAKGEFLASMSHEIRTPMNGILGMLGLVMDSGLNNEQYNKLQVAQDSANSLLAILNDVLDFSKIEAGKIELEEIDFDLRDLLESIIQSFAFRAESKHIELILDLSEIKQSRIQCDPTRIRQIITNLLGNAIKFTSQGEVLCKASLVEKTTGKLTLEIQVIDTGIGIPDDKANQLFESFSQVDSSTTRKYGGTGLGLAICKNLCLLLGGTITVESKLNEGSCFTLKIPVVEGSDNNHNLSSLDMTGLQVFIIDDNETNRIVLSEQLTSWGATILQAASVKQALEILPLKQTEIDLALVDMHMPNMDGVELCRQIRSNKCHDEIKLILMTSLNEMETKNELSKIGVNGFFTKPVTTSDLIDTLSLVVNQEQEILKNGDVITSSNLDSNEHKAKAEECDKNRDANILLVEDNRVNQMVMKGVLAKLGLSCDIAIHGIDALEKLNSHQDKYYDLIFMDCQMPEMDGYQTTQAIRNGQAGQGNIDLTIVALTAHALTTDKQRCLDAGMNYYLRKPIEKESLIKVLIKYIDYH